LVDQWKNAGGDYAMCFAEVMVDLCQFFISTRCHYKKLPDVTGKLTLECQSNGLLQLLKLFCEREVPVRRRSCAGHVVGRDDD